MFSSNASSAAGDANFVEDVFSTYLYTGNGSTQTITNGIDLAGEGGLVWIKARDIATEHNWQDTQRGVNNLIQSDTSGAQITDTTSVNSFGGNGFSMGSYAKINLSGYNYASWTFRKQPKFFDIVTWTGNGANRTIAHSLGSVPGCIIVKRLDFIAGDWQVYHRSLANTQYMVLNSTAAVATGATRWNSTTPTASVFSLGTDASVNASGGTYVAYIYAHDAGGFGLTGTDNVISCGSFTVNSNIDINLGYEPQWLLVKRHDNTGPWAMVDNMRGLGENGAGSVPANRLIAEAPSTEALEYRYGITSTGFTVRADANPASYIYIAIRRGPMKVPTTGTSVFMPFAGGAGSTIATTGFPSDLAIQKNSGFLWENRLVGDSVRLDSSSTASETTANSWLAFTLSSMNQMTQTYFNNLVVAGIAAYAFRRAPGFFDEVCYTGTGANKTETHNLQKAPELWLVKSRSATTQWVFGSSLLGANEKIVMPSPNGRVTDTTVWNNTYPTASVLSLGTSSTTNASGATFVSYLWATVAGVSKVGTYTGNGSSQTIDCGFAGGARFVMIIRATASTAQDIYIWDTARGIVSGNDPRLSLNTTAAEVTTLDTIDTASSGFVVNTDASNVNVNGAVYLYLSIA
jgi:hypothetical protein